jgi:cytoskeletal protein RodZ
MASYVPPDDSGGNAGNQQPEPEEPIPGWRKPIALVGWGVLIAVLIGLIIWGIIQLAQGPPTPAPVTTTTTTTTTPTTTAAPVVPPNHHRPTHDESTTMTTPSTGTSTTSTTPTSSADTGTPTKNSPSPGAFPHLPSVITLPSLPGLPTEITLPPGL